MDKTKNKLRDIIKGDAGKCIVIVFMTIVIIFAVYYPDYKKKHEEKKSTYQNALNYLGRGSYLYAKAGFERVPGYKDADVLAVFADVADRADDFLDEKMEIEAGMEMIPANYKGDGADVIAGFREYLASDYEKDRAAYLDKKKRCCNAPGCDYLKKPGGDYCSLHECCVSNCRDEVEPGEIYCFMHLPKREPEDEEKTGVNKNGNVGGASGKKKKTGYSSNSYRDPDDYMDVEGYYYDYRDEFENEDDAWDYLEDEWDEWD